MPKIEQLGAELAQLQILEICDFESLRSATIAAEKPDTTADEKVKRLDEIRELAAKIKKSVKACQKLEAKIKALEGF